MEKENLSKKENSLKEKKEEENETIEERKEDRPGSSTQEELATTMQPLEPRDDESAIEAIRRYMAEKLGLSEGKKTEESKKKVLDEVSVAGVVRYIQSGQCQKIVVMAGAGISTSAGIPDFRSPGSGLYDNLSKYKLPHPQAIFEIDFFMENPSPFFSLAKELFPGSYKPTVAHYFVRLLHDKNLLLRHYTQNIDGLEKVAGLPSDKVVEAHGTFYTSHCLSCRKEYSLEWMKGYVNGRVSVIAASDFGRDMKSAVLLPSGQHMPMIGLGTWQAKPEVVERAVEWALEFGYRLIDTAFNYGNEEAIGKAIEKWIRGGGNREELFITTKLPNFGNRAPDVSKYLQESLSRLRLNYVDLYLVHHPFGFFAPPTGVHPPALDYETDHISVWKEMEKTVRSGLVRNIGLSNFNAKQIQKIASAAEIKPANLQVELHAFLQQPDLLDACKALDISVTAYAPLGSPAARTHFKNKYDFQPNEVPDCLTEPAVLEIASRLHKTPAQVLLRFLTQMGVAVVPKSSSRDRIRENFQALSFDLPEKDMKKLKSLDRGENGRIFDFLFYKGVESHPEYPFARKGLLT